MGRPIDRRWVLGAAVWALAGCAVTRAGSQPSRSTSAPSSATADGQLAADLLSSLRQETATARRAVEAIWGEMAAPVVRATQDQRTFVEWGGDSSADVSATTTQAGVVLVSPSLLRVTPPARTFVITHELTHVALGVRSKAPHWVAEGAAEYTALRSSGLSFDRYAPSLASQVRAGRVPAGPPSDAELSAGSRNLRLAYQVACAWSHFLVEAEGLTTYRSRVRDAIRSGRLEGKQWRPSAVVRADFKEHLRRLCA